MQTEFFKHLKPLLRGFDLVLTIKSMDEETLSVAVMTKATGNEKINNLPPLVLTGSVEDLDKDFIETISNPVQMVAGLITNKTEFEAAVNQAKEIPSAAAEEVIAPKTEPAKEDKPGKTPKRKDQFDSIMAEYKKAIEEGEKLKALELLQEAEKIAAVKEKPTVSRLIYGLTKDIDFDKEAISNQYKNPVFDTNIPAEEKNEEVIPEPQTMEGTIGEVLEELQKPIEKEVDDTYNTFKHLAEDALKNGELTIAKNLYIQLLNHANGQEEIKEAEDSIKIVDQAIEDQRVKLEKNKRFEFLYSLGNSFLEEKNYIEAIGAYNEALDYLEVKDSRRDEIRVEKIEKAVNLEVGGKLFQDTVKMKAYKTNYILNFVDQDKPVENKTEAGAVANV